MGSMIKDNLPTLAAVGVGLALPALFPALAGAGAAGAGAAGAGAVGAGAAGAGAAGIGTTMPAWAGGAGAGLATAAPTTTLPSMLTNPWMRFGMQMFDQDDPRRHLPGPQPQVPFPRAKPVVGQEIDNMTYPVKDNTAIIPKTDLAQLLPDVHVIDQADPRRHLPGPPVPFPRDKPVDPGMFGRDDPRRHLRGMPDLGGLMGAWGVMPNLGSYL